MHDPVIRLQLAVCRCKEVLSIMKCHAIARTIYKAFIYIFILSLTVSVFISTAFSDGTSFRMWISPSGEDDISAIHMMTVSKSYCLFLPGNVDLDKWKFGHNAENLVINGIEINSGTSAASVLKPGEKNRIEARRGKYTTRISLTVMQGSKLPAMFITTESGSLRKIHKRKTNKESGSMLLYNTQGEIEYSGGLKHMKMRGNASTRYKKKNYAIKLENGANLLGMGKEKKWILLGNHLDKSLIRNQMNFDMARYVGLPFTPDCRQVAVYINNEYYGLFLLTEKIEVDDDRVDIRNLEKETEALNDKKPEEYPAFATPYYTRGGYKGRNIPNEPEDYTGGYIIEYEHDPRKYKEEESAYITKHNLFLIVHSPEYCTEQQMKYICGLMQGFENAIYSKDGKDPETGKHYSEFVDFDSLVNKYLLNEVTKNYDANMSSEYFFKPDNSVSEKVFAGPVWDLDNTYGDYTRPGNKKVLNPEAMFVNNRGTLTYWWPALSRQADFHAAVVERYHSTFLPALEILLGTREETDVLKSMDTYAKEIEKSAEMEYVLYPGLKLPQSNVKIQTGRNLAENIDFLKNYINRRMIFLYREWPLK